MWVLDDSGQALFAYNLATGELLAHYELDSANADPRDLWSDGVTVWVSDHGDKRLFAYRLPSLPQDDSEPGAVTAAQTDHRSPQSLEHGPGSRG